MSRPVGPGALWALILFCVTLAARADIRTGFGTESASFYPIDTFYSDSRYQFIIPREELRVETGEILSGLRLNLTQSSGYTFTFHIRVKHATQTDLDSMALGRFVNGGLTTIRAQSTSISATPGWKSFFTSGFSLQANQDLLVDLVMDKTASGSDSFWRVVPTADFSVVHGVNSPSPTFNLLGTTVAGVVQATRPIVELVGPSRRMPPVVTTADQLLDPSGRIDADWKVSGRNCTIQPGVTLDFGEGFGLRVQHNLIALGTEQDSIRFTGDNWEGVQLFPEAGTRARFAHCVFGGLRNNGAALNYFGGSSSLVTEVRNSTFRNGNNGYAIYAEFGKLEAVGILIDGGQIGIHGADLSQLVLEDFVIRGSSGFGLELFDCPLEEPSSLRKGLVAGNGSTGIQLDDCSGLLDRVSVVDNGSFGLATYGNSVIQLVNCILANPASAYEISVDGSDFISTGYSTVLGGSARCDQSSGGVIQLGIQTLAGDPQLDDAYHPLPGSPVIDAGSPLSTPDPDLTVADQGFFFLDQRAPLALSAVDVPEDQGGRLQFTWTASSMDLAEAERDNFYSVWRLDTLFSDQRSALPVVHSRRQVEAAIAAGRPFTWQRDGAAWNWLATVPAAQFAQYALVVETLADRLDGQPWETPMKVLWHAEDVLAESATVYGTSVDNVPPDAPLAVATVPSGSGNLRLSWQPVTTGTVNGQALAERNGVVYRVYEVPGPWAPAGSGVLVGTTAEPEFLLPVPPAHSMGFYRVEADDQIQ